MFPKVTDGFYPEIVSYNLAKTKGKRFQFDVIKDAEEISDLVLWAKTTGVIYVGGGTPKNFIQQTEVTASIMGEDVPGPPR